MLLIGSSGHGVSSRMHRNLSRHSPSSLVLCDRSRRAVVALCCLAQTIVTAAASSSQRTADVGDVFIVLLPVVVGALLAGVPALLGGWWRARKEDQRWVREQRFAAHLKVLELLHRSSRVKAAANAANEGARPPSAETAAELKSQAADLQERLMKALPPMTLLGPRSVEDALNNWTAASPEHRSQRQVALHAAVRKSLNIGD